jgi:hypothetical protein
MLIMNNILNNVSYFYHHQPVFLAACAVGIGIPLAFIVHQTIQGYFESFPDPHALVYKGKSTFIEDPKDSNKKYEVYEKVDIGGCIKSHLCGLVQAIQTHYVSFFRVQIHEQIDGQWVRTNTYANFAEKPKTAEEITDTLPPLNLYAYWHSQGMSRFPVKQDP